MPRAFDLRDEIAYALAGIAHVHDDWEREAQRERELLAKGSLLGLARRAAA
jgi:hypothetical protein